MTKLGQFRVKDEDDSATSLKPGALFFSRTNKLSPGGRRKPGLGLGQQSAGLAWRLCGTWLVSTKASLSAEGCV